MTLLAKDFDHSNKIGLWWAAALRWHYWGIYLAFQDLQTCYWISFVRKALCFPALKHNYFLLSGGLVCFITSCHSGQTTKQIMNEKLKLLQSSEVIQGQFLSILGIEGLFVSLFCWDFFVWCLLLCFCLGFFVGVFFAIVVLVGWWGFFCLFQNLV